MRTGPTLVTTTPEACPRCGQRVVGRKAVTIGMAEARRSTFVDTLVLHLRAAPLGQERETLIAFYTARLFALEKGSG